MTIKVEQETLLRVLESQPLHGRLDVPIGEGDGFLLVDFRKPISSQDYDKICSVTSDDEESIFTLSTASLSDTDSELDRRVSFADDLVTEVWTRPFTPKEEVSSLFYSTEETQRFRQEYRSERKLLSEVSVDPAAAFAEADDLLTSNPSCSRHRISRVVVLHNDKLETFFNPDDDDESLCEQKELPLSDDFFDNDSFWSGSITWY